MSLQGKWIALAKQWLIANGPCTMQEYMAGVIPLMPTHIIRSRQRASQRQLARESLRKVAVVSNGIVVSKPRLGSTRKYDHDQIIEDREKEGQIDIRDIEFKQRDAMSRYLLNHGWQRTTTPWVYERINNAD
jgi:hypothetical protein